MGIYSACMPTDYVHACVPIYDLRLHLVAFHSIKSLESIAKPLIDSIATQPIFFTNIQDIRA